MPHPLHGAMESFQSAILLDAIFAAIVVVYLRGWLRLRSTSRNRIWARRAGSFFIGLFLIWAALASPVAGFDHQLLTAHMAEHLLLMTLAPPLVWLGAPIIALRNGLPQQFMHAIIEPALRLPAVQRVGRSIGQPAFCWLAAAAARVVWHIPGIFTVWLQSGAWHMIEHASFLVAGLLLLSPCVQPWPSVSRWPEMSVILYLFLATLPCDILSGFLVFCDR